MKKIIPILNDSKEILMKLKDSQTITSKKMVCMYSSIIDSIITDQTFMSVSMEDKIIHRGYSIFDTTKIFKDKIFNIDSHIDRLVNSIQSISLIPKYSKYEFKDIIVQTALEARKIEKESDIDLRFFYSAGLGNYSIQECKDLHTFYVLAVKADNSVRPVEGTKDYTVNKDEIANRTIKAKTTNYMHNCIINKITKEKGGYLGIMTDNENNLLESPISNIAFVNNKNQFVVPTFNKTLRGTTVMKCMEYVEKELIPNGIIKEISRDDTNIKDIENGNIIEAFFVGGDFLIPLLQINDILITKEPGKISRILQEFLGKQKSEIAEELSLYKS